MQKDLMEADPDVKGMLLLNRLLFEGKGSEFVDALADFVLVKRLQISAASLLRFQQTVEAVRE